MPGVPKVQRDVMDRIDDHLGSDPARSLGGLLIGKPQADTLVIVGAVPDLSSGTHDDEITFSSDVWQAVYSRLPEEFPGAKVVGWYHSHPRSDAGLTPYDQSLHTAMFGDSSMVALVKCSRLGRKVWYGWTLARLVEMGQAAEAVGGVARAGPAAPSRKRRAVAAVSAGLLLAAAGGFGAGTALNRPATRAASRGARVHATQAEIEGLRSKLVTARGQAEAAQGRLAQARADLATTRAELQRAQQRLQAAKEPSRTFFYRYRIKPGDTMWDLSVFFYGTPAAWPKIARPNGITDPNVIQAGSILRVPLPVAK
jgi:proteasome lid subunit RPN8/RPN11